MNELTRIYKDHNVRIIEKDGEPWFVAKDVADILGYEHAPHLYRRLEEDERDVLETDTPSGKQEMVIINEYGLFAAILKSNKKEAIDFQRWITHEVLPSIRRTGSYSVQTQTLLTTDAQFEDVMKRMQDEIDMKMNNLKKMEGSQNRTRLISVIPELTDWMCGHLLRSAERWFGVKPNDGGEA